ncbi:MAG: nucleotide exchange factor GrpE [Saccharofermentanales bacterium]
MKKTKHDNAEDNVTQQDVNPADLPEVNGQEILEEAVDPRDAQLKELSDKYMRLAAEYDNFRRRSQKEKEGLYVDSIITVSAVWLTVIDNLERGVASAAEFETAEARKFAEGMELILQQARDVMKSLGITEVDALGKAFDPHTMEALMHSDDENAGENEVALVLSKGYMRGDKVIRHAKVKVVN